LLNSYWLFHMTKETDTAKCCMLLATNWGTLSEPGAPQVFDIHVTRRGLGRGNQILECTYKSRIFVFISCIYIFFVLCMKNYISEKCMSGRPSHRAIQTGSGAHSASLSNMYRGLFLGDKAAGA
jgi:hypothetical protein